MASIKQKNPNNKCSSILCWLPRRDDGENRVCRWYWNRSNIEQCS